LEIRKLETIEELKETQSLEVLVWNDTPLPIHQSKTVVQNGGLVLGAYVDEELVGFSYGFPGYWNGRTYLCSHMLGIHPRYRGQGIGAALKEAQRQEALNMGYALITWTYDPLETVNAYLNLSKLKAICGTYIENCYGEMNDGLNDGLPSDRFKVEWWINNPYLQEGHLPITSGTLAAQWEVTINGFPKLADIIEPVVEYAECYLVPVPKRFQQIKQEDMGLAFDWRTKTRSLFQTLFKNDYVAVELRKNEEAPVHFYVFRKRDTLPNEMKEKIF
jgi:predicted GNAT superfamily acetyltransferase